MSRPSTLAAWYRQSTFAALVEQARQGNPQPAAQADWALLLTALVSLLVACGLLLGAIWLGAWLGA